MTETYFTRGEIAAKFRVNPRTVDNWVADGLLNPVFIGRKLVRFTEAEVQAFIGRSAGRTCA